MTESRGVTGPRRVPCAGAVVLDAAGRLLLIKRGHPPARGRWSLPGGRCLPGEPADRAALRELFEETGLRARVVRHAGRVERDGVGGAIYVIDDFVCAVTGGTLLAADDADAACWADADAMGSLPLAPLLRETLREWDLLPR